MSAWLERGLLRIYDVEAVRAAMWRVSEFAVMNYGFAAEDAAVQGETLGLRLYEEVVRGVPLEGKRVLEVGCGRAGGLMHLALRGNPAEAVGVDFSRRAVSLARQRAVALPVVRIEHGLADALPVPDARFDVVVNVESSHCYASRARFFAEVRRVLAPGGRFCFTDLFSVGDLAGLRAALAAAGLVVREEHDITANVARSMRLDDTRRRGLIERLPKFLWKPLRAFAGTTDSPMYLSFMDGRRRYLRFVIAAA